MITIDMTVSLQRTRVFPGESFFIYVQLKNQSNTPIQVPDPNSHSAFTYVLTGMDNKEDVYEFSTARYMVSQNPNIRDIPAVAMITLSPGEIFEYSDDFSGVAIEDVHPGRYRLHTTLSTEGNETMTSVPVEVEFIQPRPRAFVAIADDQEGVISWVLLTQKEDDGAGNVLQRESVQGNRLLGSTYRRESLAKKMQADDVAIALSCPEFGARRWIACLSAGQLSVRLYWDRSLIRTTSALDLGLEEPRLLPVGRMLQDGRSAFLVVGRKGKSEVLREVRFEGTIVPDDTVEKGAPTPPPPPPAIDQPEVTDHLLSGEFSGHRFVRYFSTQGRFQLIGAEAKAGTTQILVWDFPQGEVAVQPRVVCERNETCVALSVPPLQEQDQGYADALFGPSGEEQKMLYVRVPLDGNGTVSEWAFSQKALIKEEPDRKGPIASRWILTTGVETEPPVLARVDDRLLVGWPTVNSTDWSPILTGLDEAGTLELLSFQRSDRFNRSSYVLVITPEHGILTLPLDKMAGFGLGPKRK